MCCSYLLTQMLSQAALRQYKQKCPTQRLPKSDPRQTPCLRIHVSASMSQRPDLDPICKIHVSDLCLSIHVCGPSTRSMSQDPLQDPCLRTLYKMQVSGSMSPNLRLSLLIYGSYMQDPRLRSHFSASIFADPLDKIHVSGALSQHPYLRIRSIHVSGRVSHRPYPCHQHSVTQMGTAQKRERSDKQKNRKALQLQT